jgi:hypothetical protein
MDTLERRLERIEEKLDSVLLDHTGRLSRVEAHAGVLKAGFGLLSSLIVAGFVWLLNHLPKVNP